MSIACRLSSIVLHYIHVHNDIQCMWPFHNNLTYLNKMRMQAHTFDRYISIRVARNLGADESIAVFFYMRILGILSRGHFTIVYIPQ